ncbi:MAG: hypothetical protein HOC71_06035 [Candidatus Latescibacteria bacterium]|jgi:hypothetical protein|nr:hypothetical protein [Candidatus Latescibacterota bacterium]
MKPYLALYWKELKSISGLAVILFILSVAAYIYDFLTRTFPGIQYPHLINFSGHRFVFASVFMLPVILAYSLNIERKTKTHYLGLSVPVPKYTSMLCKFLAVISVGILPILALNLFEIGRDIKNIIYVWRAVKADPELITFLPDKSILIGMFIVYLKDSISYFMRIFVYCGMVCLAQGVKETVKRRRILVWIAVFVTSLSIFSVFFERVTGSPTYHLANLRLSGSPAYYCMLAGFTFIIPGLFLYEKYSEV